MRHIPRALEARVTTARRAFPVVVVTGPRRAGKTSLLRRLVPAADCVLLEDPDILGRVRADPHGFLDERRGLPFSMDVATLDGRGESGAARQAMSTRVVAPGVRAASIEEFVALLSADGDGTLMPAG